jgi:hypothetical protein
MSEQQYVPQVPPVYVGEQVQIGTGFGGMELIAQSGKVWTTWPDRRQDRPSASGLNRRRRQARQRARVGPTLPRGMPRRAARVR